MKKLFIIFTITALFSITSAAGVPVSKPKQPAMDESGYSSTIAREYLSGVFAVRNNDFEAASGLFAAALAKHPGDIILLQNAYQYALIAGHYEDATKYGTQYLKYNKKATDATLLLAINAASKKRFKDASAILANIPDNAVSGKKGKRTITIEQLLIPFIKMWAIAGEGNYDLALSMLNRHNSGDISATFIDLQMALLYSLKGNVKEAEATFDKIIAQKGLMPYHMAKSAAGFYESAGKWDKALAVYRQYRAQHPASAHFVNSTSSGLYIKNPVDGLAEVLKESARLMLGNHMDNEGLIYIRMALMLKPGDDEAAILLAGFYEEQSAWQQAIDLYDKIAPDSDLYQATRVSMAEDLYKLGKKTEAKKLLLHTAENIHDKYIPLVTLADLLRQDNNYQEAIEIYSRVLENINKTEQSSWAIFFARAICYERVGKWNNAEQDLLAALELHPKQPDIINYLAYGWIEHNKNLEKARDMLLHAASMRPDDAQILDSAGWALYKLKDYKNAAVFLEKASALIPQNAVVNDHLGNIYWMQGRHYEAKYQWQRAIKYGPADSSTEAELMRKVEKGLDLH